MTDLSVTAASVVPGVNAILDHGTGGETIAAGKYIYMSSTTKKWMLADSNSATAEARAATAVALNGVSLNQPITVQKGGQVTAGATLTPGVQYYLSDTPGGICPVADVGSGEYVCLLGVALSASVLDLNFKYTGVSN
jgi:hypothetical protein